MAKPLLSKRSRISKIRKTLNKAAKSNIGGSTEEIVVSSDSSSNYETRKSITKKTKEPGVVVVSDESECSDGETGEATGIDDIKFGRRSLPRRCSRATRYHMLLEVALQRKRQRRIRGCKEPGRPRSTTLASAKKTRAESSCALLYSTDPFETSDESDADWDPCKIYGDEARRRLKSCQSETESDSQEECESSDTEANENQVAGESNDITKPRTRDVQKDTSSHNFRGKNLDNGGAWQEREVLGQNEPARLKKSRRKGKT